MPARFDLSALSRRRSAKFALASLMAVVVLTLVTFTARAWRNKASSATRHGAAVVQQTPAAAASGYVRRARLRPRLHEALGILGDRLEQPGKERLTLIGVLKRQRNSAAVPFRLITELPNLMRLEERINGQLHVIGFDGNNGWAIGSAFDNSAQETIESLVFDSVDHFFLGQTQGLAIRPLGSRFRLDDGAAVNYSGPFYDIYQMIDLVKIGPTTRQQPKLFYLNSDTQTLERVRYRIARDGAPVDVEAQITNWQRVSNQNMPRSITRSENGQEALTLTIESATIGPRVADGIFNRP